MHGKCFPFYDADFLFLPAGADCNSPRKGEWLLEVQFYDDGEPDDGGEDPSPATFKDPTEFNLELYLCAFVALKHLDKTNWYYNIYGVTEWPELDGFLR